MSTKLPADGKCMKGMQLMLEREQVLHAGIEVDGMSTELPTIGKCKKAMQLKLERE